MGKSAYGGHNLSPPGWNRVKVAAKTLWGPVFMSPGILNSISLINTGPRDIHIESSKQFNLYVWAEQVVSGSAKTALKFNYEI